MSVAESLYEDPNENEIVFDSIELGAVTEEPSDIQDEVEASSINRGLVASEIVATRGLARGRTALPSAENRPSNRQGTSKGNTISSTGTLTRQSKKVGSRSRSEDSEEDLLRIYLQDIGKHPLLTKDDEVSLGKRMEIAGHAQDYLNGHPKLSMTDRQHYESLVADGTQAAKEFTQSNLRLVVSIAKKYQACGMPLLDLIQEGNLGLMHAVEKFEYRKGFKFSTYATWWIRQAITRGIANTNRTIRLPVHAVDDVGRMLKTRKQLEQELGREITIAELAVELGVPEEQVIELIKISQDPISLSDSLGESGELEVGDIVVDSSALPPDEEVLASMVPRMISDALAGLDEREREIVKLRFGLDNGGDPRTLDDLGERFNLTRERIRQIEARALAKLRHPSREIDLRDLLRT